MSDTTTPILGLVQPAVGGSADTWGNKQNTNETLIDNYAGSTNGQIAQLWAAIQALQSGEGAVGRGYQEPIGTVKWWPSDAYWPSGYVICDGTLYAVATYPSAAALLGNRWGGDGVNTFGVPDLRGSIPVGMDEGTGRTQGQYGPDRWAGYGGTATVTLTLGQAPPHSHGGYTDWQGNHWHNVPTQATVYAAGGAYAVPAGGYGWFGYGTDSQGNHYHAISSDTQGGGAAHTNCQPGALGYWIIKVALF